MLPGFAPPFLCTVSDQKMDGGKVWEQGWSLRTYNSLSLEWVSDLSTNIWSILTGNKGELLSSSPNMHPTALQTKHNFTTRSISQSIHQLTTCPHQDRISWLHTAAQVLGTTCQCKTITIMPYTAGNTYMYVAEVQPHCPHGPPLPKYVPPPQWRPRVMHISVTLE